MMMMTMMMLKTLQLDQTRETSKDKAPTKSSKTGKSASTKEPVKELVAKVVMDDAVNTVGEDVVRDDDQP
ncbi:hypothetical protein Tco_0137189 [Tanacetum coccineum]